MLYKSQKTFKIYKIIISINLKYENENTRNLFCSIINKFWVGTTSR